MADRIRILTARLLLLFALGALLGPMTGCDEEGGADTVMVEINGQTFHLELAADPETRQLGLGGRSEIADDGGMIFVFKNPIVLQFVMRDCLTDIDIIFLDGAGRITALHQMTVEEPEPARRDGESDSVFYARRSVYEQRLKKYSSRFAAQFASSSRAAPSTGSRSNRATRSNSTPPG